MPIKPRKTTRSSAGGCYSRRLEEVFVEDYPKEGKDAENKENCSLSSEADASAAGTGKSDSSAEACGLGPDVQGGTGADQQGT
jgi:hypothetical protein